MKKVAFVFSLLCLSAALPLWAQDAPVLPRPLREADERMPPHLSPEMIEEARRRREAWRQLSPEDRHQLRRDIRDAGRALYPRRHRWREE